MNNEIQLARKLNFVDIYLVSLGYIIGAGIFILIGKTAKYAKNYTWLAFLIAGILSILNILTYIELDHVFTKNSSEYDYILKALNKPTAIISTIILICVGIFSVSTVGLSIGEYLEKIFGINKYIISLVSIIFFSIVNISGIKSTINYNNYTTAIEIFSIIVIILYGLYYINLKKNNLQELSFPKNNIFKNFKGITYSAFIAMFAYGGFETTVKLSEEAKNPKIDIPLALILSIISAIILYVLISYIITKIFNYKTVINSVSPLADIANLFFGKNIYYIYALIAIMSISSGMVISILGTSRMIHAVSKYFPELKFLTYVDKNTRTPIISILFVSIFSILALFVKNVEKSAAISNYFFFAILALVNLSLFILHFDEKYKTQFNNTLLGGINKEFPITPLIAFISSVAIIIFGIFQKN